MAGDWTTLAGPISGAVSAIAIVSGGVFSFAQWLDLRHRELKQRRQDDYNKLLEVLSGAGTGKVHSQLAALYQLLNFEEYLATSISVLEASNRILAAQGNQPWTQLMAPEVNKVISKLREKLN